MKKRLVYVTVFSLCFGIIFVLTSALIEVIYPPKNPSSLGTLEVIIIRILQGGGIALFTSTFVNWLKYFVDSAETLVHYGFIDRLSKEEMNDLKNKIEAALYFKSNNHDIKDNFFNFFEKELSSLLSKPYYKSFNLTVNCKIHDKYIYKTTRKIIELVNPSKRNSIVKLPFSAEMQKVDNISNDKLYQIKKFKIDSDDFKDELQKRLVPKDLSQESNDAYCVKFDASWDIKLKKQCIIEMEIETIVPLDDVCFSNKITYPCKLYNVIYIIDNTNYMLSWHTFGLLGNHKDKIIEETLDNGVHIGFKDWILPGDGIVITLNNALKNGK